MVRLPGETILRRPFQTLDERGFILKLDGSGQLIPISYDQVLQVQKEVAS
jgi:hypothetical protein